MWKLMAVAWRNLWRHTRRSLITASAMALGVAFAMAMACLTDGMSAEFFEVLVNEKLGHVQLHDPAFPEARGMHDVVEDADAVVAELRAIPTVAAVAPRIFAFALASGREDSAGAMIQGIDPTGEDGVSGVSQDVIDGTGLGAGDGATPGIEALVGRRLAEDLAVAIGDEIVLLGQAADGSMANDLATVKGIVRTGNSQIDRQGILIPLGDAQRLLAMEGVVHEILVVGEGLEPAAAMVAGVRDVGEGRDLLVRTWQEADPTTAAMIEFQTNASYVMLVIVFAVASLGVLNTMLMAVFERTRELGLLKALGLTPLQVMGLVLFESACLAGLAAVGGLALGGLFDLYLVKVGLDFSVGGEGLDYQGVQLDARLKGVVRPGMIVVTIATLFVVSVLAAVWPAIRAARLRPVQALQGR